MRTTIVIDEALMDAAVRAGGFKTTRDAVEAGLCLLTCRAAYRNLKALRGRLSWSLEGDWRKDASQVQAPPSAYKAPQ